MAEERYRRQIFLAGLSVAWGSDFADVVEEYARALCGLDSPRPAKIRQTIWQEFAAEPRTAETAERMAERIEELARG